MIHFRNGFTWSLLLLKWEKLGSFLLCSLYKGSPVERSSMNDGNGREERKTKNITMEREKKHEGEGNEFRNGMKA